MPGMLTLEQQQFSDQIARFAAREYGLGPARPRHGFDRARLKRLADLGALALAIPESSVEWAARSK